MVSEVREGDDSIVESVTPDSWAESSVDANGQGSNANIAKAAHNVGKMVTNSKKLTEIVLERLGTAAELTYLASATNLMSFSECVTDKDFERTLYDIGIIVSKYEAGVFKIGELDSDILKLGSYLFFLAGRVNAVEMAAIEAESAVKVSGSRALIRAKEIATEGGGKLSDEVAKALASIAVEPIREKISNRKIVSHTAKGLYYAGSQLLKVMNDVARRVADQRRTQGTI